MANKDYPQGFRPYGEIKQVAVMESGSAVYAGEFVRLADDGQVDPVTAGATILGLCLDNATASGVAVRVSVSPDQLYIGQADETEIDAQTDIGNVCDVVATAHDTTYLASRMEIDSSNVNTTSGQLLILGLHKQVGNAFGAQAEVICKINEHQAFGADAFAGI